jgi:hypothetical protein
MAIKDLITRDTNIIRIFNEHYDDITLSKQTGIPKEIIEYNNSWYQHDGIWYYFKRFYEFNKGLPIEMKFINELIGEQLAKKLEIPVVRYEIAQKNDIIGLMSENFVRKEQKYYFMINLNLLPNLYDDTNLTIIKKKCNSERNYEELLSEILKMVAIDLYSSQDDRNVTNIQFTKKNGELHLTPLYDFEDSFENSKQSGYRSALLGLFMQDIEKYPQLKEYLVTLFETGIKNILDQIENERKIIIPTSIKDKYNIFEQDRQMVLKI